MSKNDITIRLETDIDLTSKTFFKRLAKSLFQELPEHLHPNRFGGYGENPKRVICESGLNEAADEWSDAGGGLTIARKKQTIQYIVYFTHRKGFNDRGRRFPWRCVVHFNSKAKWLDVKCFMKVLVTCLQPAFALSSTLSEIDDQHRVVHSSKVGMIEEKVHLDLGGQLPGIYRMTYFGPWSVEKVGKSKILGLEFTSKHSDGFILDLTEVVDLNNVQQELRHRLGRSNFFDKTLFHPKGLEPSKEDAAVIELAIKDHLARKRLRKN